MCVYVNSRERETEKERERERERGRGRGGRETWVFACLCVAKSVTPSVSKLLNVARSRNLLGKTCFGLLSSPTFFYSLPFFACPLGPITSNWLSIFKKPKRISPIRACLHRGPFLLQTYPGGYLFSCVSSPPVPVLLLPTHSNPRSWLRTCRLLNEMQRFDSKDGVTTDVSNIPHVNLKRSRLVSCW